MNQQDAIFYINITIISFYMLRADLLFIIRMINSVQTATGRVMRYVDGSWQVPI